MGGSEDESLWGEEGHLHPFGSPFFPWNFLSWAPSDMPVGHGTQLGLRGGGELTRGTAPGSPEGASVGSPQVGLEGLQVRKS